MTSLCPLRLKSFIIDFYLDYINRTSPRTQLTKRFFYFLHFIIIFNLIICYIINDEQVSLLLFNLPHFIGGIRIYNTTILILNIVFQAHLVKYLYVFDDKYRKYFTEMLEISIIYSISEFRTSFAWNVIRFSKWSKSSIN